MLWLSVAWEQVLSQLLVAWGRVLLHRQAVGMTAMMIVTLPLARRRPSRR